MRSYMPPIEPGDVMRSFSIGPVTRSAQRPIPGRRCGDRVPRRADHRRRRRASGSACDVSVAPMELHLGVLGMTGFTGYFGMLDIGRPEAEHTVVVSAASGAWVASRPRWPSGSGAGSIGIAGGPVKCAYLIDELGLDAAVDYKSNRAVDRRSTRRGDSERHRRVLRQRRRRDSRSRVSSTSTTTAASCCAAASRATTTWRARLARRGT